MNPSSKDVVDLLVASNYGVFGTDLFIGLMPDEPNACVVVIDTGGFAPASGYVLENPTVQVRVRGKVGDYLGGWSKAQLIKCLLHDHAEYTSQSDGSRIIGIWAMGDVLSLGYDEKQRPSFSVNFRIQRTGV